MQQHSHFYSSKLPNSKLPLILPTINTLRTLVWDACARCSTTLNVCSSRLSEEWFRNKWRNGLVFLFIVSFLYRIVKNKQKKKKIIEQRATFAAHVSRMSAITITIPRFLNAKKKNWIWECWTMSNKTSLNRVAVAVVAAAAAFESNQKY